MLTVGDVVQITVEGRSVGEDTTNVYYYGCNATSIDSGDTYLNVLTAFDGIIMPPLIAVVNTQTSFTQLTIKNISNGLDYGVLTIARVGTLAGDALPAYLTFTAQLVRSNLATRNGSKRFSGLIEAGVTGNAISWVPAQKTALQNALGADLISAVPGSWNLQPIIVGRFPQGDPNAGELDITRTSNVASVRLGTRTTSQTSRKLPQVY